MDDGTTDAADRKADEACRLTRSLLSEWIDGDVAPRMARFVAEHLGGCPPCRRLAASLRAVVADMARLSAGDRRRAPTTQGGGGDASDRGGPSI